MPASNVIRLSDNLTIAQLGLKKVYRAELPRIPQQYKDWLREETATEFIHTEYEHTGLGAMPEKPVGTPFQTTRPFFSGTKAFTLKTYGLALEIQYETKQWDLYDIYTPVAKELARTAMIRYDLEAYGILNNSFVTTNATYVNRSGEAICSATHARLDGGTWKNRPSSTFGLSMAALETASIDLRQTVDETGQYLLLVPKTLIVATAGRWLAGTLIKSERNPENANEAFNNAKDMGMMINTSPYITLTTGWWVTCDTKSDRFRIHIQMGDAPDLVKDQVPNTRNELWSSYCSFSIVVWNGRGMYGDPGI